MPPQRVLEIVHGRWAVTADTALRLGLLSDNHLGLLATTILAGGEGQREGVARPEA